MKCIYCDFYSVGDRNADWSAYVDALIAELHSRISELPRPLQTIYIGGGTPSLMPCKDFLSLCEALKPYAGVVKEFTIEVNPDDVTPEKLETWKKGGVNRLSMGVQSFDDGLLKTIRRRHTADTARRAYAMARQVFDNVSIDLIYGLPGQTLEKWRSDVMEAIAMRPEHISSYSLMYEEGTALTLLRDRGDLSETPEHLSEEMMRVLIAKLKAAGYDHYEISNFALPGYRSLHNSSYWKTTSYLGLGPSAHSYDGVRCRSANKADIMAYLSGSRDGILTREYLTDEELREEYVMLRLRTREGINLDDYRHRFGKKAFADLLNLSEDLIKKDLIDMDGGNLSLTESSILISDSIILTLA